MQTELTCYWQHVCSTCQQPGHTSGDRECKGTKKSWRSNTKRRESHICAKSSLGGWQDCVNSTLVTETTEAPPDAPSVEHLPRTLVDVVNEHPELFQIVTPIKPDVFWEKLCKHPNQPFITSVLQGLIHGFWPFAEILGDYPTTLDLHCDDPSDNKKLQFYMDQCEKEFKLGCFSKPFRKQLMPGMACMPIFIN